MSDGDVKRLQEIFNISLNLASFCLSESKTVENAIEKMLVSGYLDTIEQKRKKLAEGGDENQNNMKNSSVKLLSCMIKTSEKKAKGLLEQFNYDLKKVMNYFVENSEELENEETDINDKFEDSRTEKSGRNVLEHYNPMKRSFHEEINPLEFELDEKKKRKKEIVVDQDEEDDLKKITSPASMYFSDPEVVSNALDVNCIFPQVSLDEISSLFMKLHDKRRVIDALMKKNPSEEPVVVITDNKEAERKKMQFCLTKEFVMKHIPSREIVENYRKQDYSEVDKHAVSICSKYQKMEVSSTYQNFNSVARELCLTSYGDLEKARSIYRFVCQFLEYKLGTITSPMVAWKSRQQVCEGFVEFFERLCESVDVISFPIAGKVKNNEGFVQKEKHVWNGLFIDGYFFLVDCTWSWGTSEKREFRDYWWLTHPEDFIRTHFPKQRHFQLLKRPISFQEFSELVVISYFGVSNGFNVIEPHILKEIYLGSNERNPFYTILFRNSEDMIPTLKLFAVLDIDTIEKQRKIQECSEYMFYQCNQTSIEVNLYPPVPGDFSLKVFCMRETDMYLGKKLSNHVVSFNVKCFSPSNHRPPILRTMFNKRNCYLFTPRQGVITDDCVLKIRVPNAERVLICEEESLDTVAKNLDSTGEDDVFVRKVVYGKFKHCSKISVYANFKGMGNDLFHSLLVFYVGK